MLPIETRVIRREALVQPEGRTRGWAQADFDGIPAGHPQRLDFAPLRMFAQGTMLPGEGFDMHRHEGIDNVLLVRSGHFRHRGGDGSDWVLGPNDVFAMSAGTGAEHAEHVQGDEPVECIVIWLHSDPPLEGARQSRAHLDPTEARNRLAPLASGGALRCGGLSLQCDAAILCAELHPGAQLEHVMPAGERAYVAALDGNVTVAGQSLRQADRAMLAGTGAVPISSQDGGTVAVVRMLAPPA